HLLAAGIESPEQIDATAIQSHLLCLQRRGLAVASIARALVAIRMWLRYLCAAGAIGSDIAELLETPRTWQRLPGVISPKQVTALVRSLDPQGQLYLRDRAILETLYATGLRASELAGLTCPQVNLEIGYVRCLGKGNRERVVPLGRQAIRAVRQYLQELRPRLLAGRSEERIFLTRTGRPMDRHNLWRLVVRSARRAGIQARVSPHTLRHCFGSHLLAGGADLRIVQELLGHASVTTTQIYTHVDRQRLRSIHARFHPRP
ncbi:MAG: tyrosine recombinase, partial [Phycisphaerae bacterium]